MDSEYEFGASKRSEASASASSPYATKTHLIVLGLVLVAASLLAIVGVQYFRNEQVVSQHQQQINDLTAQLSDVTTRLLALDASLSVQRAVQRSNASALARALEQLRDVRPCTLPCENGGVPALDCEHCESCDAGWTGALCHVPDVCAAQCDADAARCRCAHGAALDAARCVCACLPGWLGAQCEQVDPAASAAQEQDFLAQLLSSASTDAQLRRASSAGLHLPSLLGYGRRAVTGRATQPLLALPEAGGERFTDPLGQVYAVPQGVTLDVLAQSRELPPAKHEVFASQRDWQQRLFDWQRSSTLVPSPLAQQYGTASAVFSAFFAAGASLGVTTVQVPLYSTQLRADVATYALTPAVQQALDYLAGFEYPARKDLYFTFLDHVGTTVVVRSLAGGAIERQTRFKGALWNETGIGARVRDNSWVKEQLEISWSDKTGSGQFTHADKRFTNNVDYVHQICRGGTSAESDCGAVRSLEPWRAKLWALPVAVVDTVVPVTRLVKSATLLPRLTLALSDYINAQHDHYSKN